LTSVVWFATVPGVARRSKHLLHELIQLPWWASLVVAGLVYIGIRWLLPAFGSSNQFLRPLAASLQSSAVWFAFPFLVTAVLAAAGSYYRRRLLEGQSGLETLRALSWQDFERLVGEAYRRRGYTVEEIGGSAPDGGVDLTLYAGGRKTVVQCKRWRTTQIGVSLIRELYGVMVAEKAERGIFVTTGTFTPDAMTFARSKPLELVDGRALAKLVEGVQTSKTSPQHKPATPACPKCGGEMVQRVAKRGANAGKSFWGCLRYPTCTGVRNE
jgi:restriction system protein